MKDDLLKRVEQFVLMELPGQPKMMHMGTSYLVNDLFKEIQRLDKQNKKMLNALKYVRDAKGVLIEGEIVDEILPAIEAGEEE